MGGLYFTTMSTRVAGKETQRTIVLIPLLIATKLSLIKSENIVQNYHRQDTKNFENPSPSVRVTS